MIYMPEVSKTHLGGTMRLGLRPSVFSSGSESWSKIRRLYGGGDVCWERHRHRYEINPDLVTKLESGSGSGSSVASATAAMAEASLSSHGGPTSPRLGGYPGSDDAAGITSRSFRRASSSASAFSTLAPSDAASTTHGSESSDNVDPSTSLRFVGKSTSGARMQILELQDHPYFVGMQAHPEFASRPLNPSPPFLGLVAAACGMDVLGEQLARGGEYKPPHPTSMMVLGQVDGEARPEEEAEMAKLGEQKKQKANVAQSVVGVEAAEGAATPVGARSPVRRQSVVETNGVAHH